MITEMNQEKKQQIDRASKMRLDNQEHFREEYFFIFLFQLLEIIRRKELKTINIQCKRSNDG